MKALICEMCSSKDLIKQDGFYVCQSCGTKYSVEEARKLMVEGTVKVDNTDKLANLYQVARRARDNNDSEGAAKYYDMIQIEDPTSWEASFYTTYFRAMNCKIGEIRSAAISVSNCLNTVMGLVHDHVKGKGEQQLAIREISGRCIKISSALHKSTVSHYNGIDAEIRSNYRSETVGRIVAADQILFCCGDAIESVFRDDPGLVALAADTWIAGIKKLESYAETSWLPSGDDNIQKYTQKLIQYNRKGFASLRLPQLNAIIEQQQRILAGIPEKSGSKTMRVFGILIATVPLVVALFMWVSGRKGEDFWFSVVSFFFFCFPFGIMFFILGRQTKNGDKSLNERREWAYKAIRATQCEIEDLKRWAQN